LGGYDRLLLNNVKRRLDPKSVYDDLKEAQSGVVKIVHFQKGFLSPFLFLYKLSAILDF
jgi:hypothetical protein